MNCEIYDPFVRESVARWGNCYATQKKSRKRGNYFKASLFCDIQKVDTVRMKKQENLFFLNLQIHSPKDTRMVMQNEIKKCPNSKRKTALLYCQYLNADVSIHVKAVEKHLHYTNLLYRYVNMQNHSES